VHRSTHTSSPSREPRRYAPYVPQLRIVDKTVTLQRYFCTTLLLVAVVACAPGVDEKQRPEASSARVDSAAQTAPVAIAWPPDPVSNQAPESAGVPTGVVQCSSRTPLLTSDSVGAVRAGQPLSELVSRCPYALPRWRFDEGIPEPVLIVKLGTTVVFAVLDDTLPASEVYRAIVVDPGARTSAGVHPGMTLAQVAAIYGLPSEMGTAECFLYATFTQEPGIGWRLDLPGEVDCAKVEFMRVADLPLETRLEAAIHARP
jgi:hypothetical protein